MMPKYSQNDLAILTALQNLTSGDGHGYRGTLSLARESRIPCLKAVRRIVRKLARHRLAYSRMITSGGRSEIHLYCITPQGSALIEAAAAKAGGV